MDDTGATRLALLETIREYALERLEESAAVAAREAHAAHYLALLQAAEPELFGPEQGAWLARLETEHDNLRAALAWALERRDASLALQLSGAAVQFWWARGHRTEAPRWLAAALALPGADAPTVHRATALNGLAVHRQARGDYAGSHALMVEALALRRAALMTNQRPETARAAPGAKAANSACAFTAPRPSSVARFLAGRFRHSP